MTRAPSDAGVAEIRRHPGESNIDEVVANGVDFHIEQMDAGCYWFVLRKGDDEMHFWLRTKRNAAITLSCPDEDDAALRDGEG